MTRRHQYWGVYDTGMQATPRGPKKIVEEMAGMLSNQQSGVGREVCIHKAVSGFGTLGGPTGVCYVNGIRQKARKRVPK